MSREIPKFPFCWVEGDCFPELIMTLEDTDLTLFTTTLLLRRNDGSVLVKPSTGIDPVQGHFKFSWVVGDLLEGFNQEANVRFVDAGGKPLTSPLFHIDVRGQLV